jgi:hypothetical protein
LATGAPTGAPAKEEYMDTKHHFRRLMAAAALCLATVLGAPVAWAQNPVAAWNVIAENAIIGVAKKPPTSAPIYMVYVHASVYDAVNAIDKRYQPFAVQLDAPAGASQDAAAIAAAHRALVRLFPSQQPTLDAAYVASLASIPDGLPKTDGIAVGEAAANAFLDSRMGDGLEANVPVVLGSGPGAWQPTAPAAPVTPWVGQFRPFSFSSSAQFRPAEGPPALDSYEWAGDYNRTQLYGGKDFSLRTPAQTEIGLFWTDHATKQYEGALAGLANSQSLNTADAARLYAVANIALADALVSCLEAKYHFLFWRPVTAIHAGDTDGNDNTVIDPAWQPLAPTPNHPEYPAAHGCATGAFTQALATFFGTDFVPVSFSSAVTNTTHHFERFSDVMDEVSDARIYGGMHYHYSIVQGRNMGRKIVRNLFKNYFGPWPSGEHPQIP